MSLFNIVDPITTTLGTCETFFEAFNSNACINTTPSQKLDKIKPRPDFDFLSLALLK